VGTTSIAEFTDPRLVAVYDSVNQYGPGTQPDFVQRVAAEVGASTILDVGCGTGLITCALARVGYSMTGLEPSPLMLDVARSKLVSDRVRWILGDVSAIPAGPFDLAIMTGHVAQFFLSGESWRNALAAVRRSLRHGGWLAFESRNPDAGEWKRWAGSARRSVHVPRVGPIETWTEVDAVGEGVVSCTNHYLFTETGEHLLSPLRLRFRTAEELDGSLVDAGFTVEHVYGDWDRCPAAPTAPELIVVARRTRSRRERLGAG
jgi:SAM-dependent methyltransferase